MRSTTNWNGSNKAIAAAAAEIQANRDTVAKELGEQYAAIFDAHLQMLTDPKLRSELDSMIRERHYLAGVCRQPHAAALRQGVSRTCPAATFAERASDIFDIEKRLLRNLLGRRREELSQLTSPVVILAHDLTPSETANLDRKFVRGFVTEVGGPGSHTAIVAEGMEIPAVVGVGPFLTDVSGGDLVIIDGDQGLVILQPDEETIARYRHEAEAAAIAGRAAGNAARSAGGNRRRRADRAVWATSSFPTKSIIASSAAPTASACIAPSFCTCPPTIEPTEETHFDAYSRVIEAMGDKPVVIRTLDLGADKLAQMPSPAEERNPVLGLRSIRMSLRNLPLFRTQLRAILRASALGDVRVMFPLITTLLELRQARMVLADVMEDLDEHKIPFNRDLPVGMMVEVPAAVMMIDRFVEEVDFVSIGTNDLVQYSLAVDRSNKDVAGLYNTCDPAVLRLIEMTDSGRQPANIPANLCGRMSSSTTYTQLLLGLGLRQFSVTPGAIPEVKRIIRAANIPQCEAIAARAMTMENARDIKAYLREELKKIAPELDQR